MNRKEYNGDTRYAKVLEKMDLLGIMDVTTTRQDKNGTIVWKLPIKNEWNNGSLIEVASFETGYVRNQNSGYSNYQLNKRCEGEPEYFPEYKTVNGAYKKTGKYTKFTTRACKLIPIEIERLEYLISYCLKNYYIKHANFVPNGEYVPKWRYDNLADAAKLDYEKRNNEVDLETRITNLSLQNEVLQNKLEQEKDGRCEEVADFQRESDAKIRDLEVRLEESDLKVRELQIDFDKNDCGHYERIRDLENKLDTIKRISDYE